MNTLQDAPPFVDLDRVMATPLNNDPHTLVVDASDIGLAPGAWPLVLETNAGNGRRLLRSRGIGGGQGYVYRQDCGCIELHVLND